MDTDRKDSSTAHVSRRSFLIKSGLAAAAGTILGSQWLLGRGWISEAEAATLEEILDTFNGLLTFIVPGPDDYSVAQGVSTVKPGAIEADVTGVFIDTLDDIAPYFPSFSAVVATILNNLAFLIRPAPIGTFASQFAGLTFAEKVVVIQIMDSTDELKPLSGILLAFGAYLVYSEAGVFDPGTRTIDGTPVGWSLSGYQGVADGRDELLGYFDHRKNDRRPS